jgi:hypothetical protein
MRKIDLIAVVITLFTLCIPMSPLVQTAASGADEQAEKAAENRFAKLEEKWGVKPLALRLTGADHFLDFRYLVVDAEKAKPVMDRKKKAVLKDEETGKTFHVTMTKIGAMRGTSTAPKAGKQYFIMFTNSEKAVLKGQKVTVVIEEFRAENLVVE